MRKLLVLCLLALLVYAVLGAPWQQVISYGADLSPEDKIAVVRDFGLPASQDVSRIPSVNVTHAEEVQLLSRVAPPEVIGTQAVSSVYIESASSGSGLTVSTKNINWVTPAMYANAMATGGIRDAKAIVTAPTPVSGTAALTGIFKAFAYLSGRALPESARLAAADELVSTGELGQAYGQEPAARFMERTKEEVVRTQALTYEEIRSVVVRVAGEERLQLTDAQIRRVTDVMVRVSKLGLSLDQLKTQLKNFANQTVPQAGGISGILARIVAFFQNLFRQLVGFVGRALRLS